MRLVFAGTPDTALPSLRALLDSQHEVVAVVTRPDAPAGRGRTLQRSPVGALADELGLEVLTPERASDTDFLSRLRELAPDCCPIVAYGGVIPREGLGIPRNGWINLHFSLLPAWRGAAPVQHALLHGDDITGATTFLLEEGLDTGPILGTVAESVRPTDTAGDLLARLADSGAGLLVATMDAIGSGVIAAVRQPPDGVSRAPKLTTEDARIDWSQPAVRVDRQIRACTPTPGAWTTLRGERLGLGTVTPVPHDDALAPGQIAAGKHEVKVGTASHAVLLGEVRPAGKRAMVAADWARGVRLTDSDELGA